ncbi:hypothetical protein HK104_010626 [Borealophlyctis nickersoniae]|nr:hypothetical protein HK104_010626 [Borealophlyctis nickersoniae]
MTEDDYDDEDQMDIDLDGTPASLIYGRGGNSSYDDVTYHTSRGRGDKFSKGNNQQEERVVDQDFFNKFDDDFDDTELL